MTFDIIQNNQFSTFLLAMSHIAVIAEEETKESKLKRKAVQEELQRLYAELEENKNNQPHPLETLIDKL